MLLSIQANHLYTTAGSTDCKAHFAIDVDGSQIMEGVSKAKNTDQMYNPLGMITIVNLAAGPHTIKVQWK